MADPSPSRRQAASKAKAKTKGELAAKPTIAKSKAKPKPRSRSRASTNPVPDTTPKARSRKGARSIAAGNATPVAKGWDPDWRIPPAVRWRALRFIECAMGHPNTSDMSCSDRDDGIAAYARRMEEQSHLDSCGDIARYRRHISRMVCNLERNWRYLVERHRPEDLLALDDVQLARGTEAERRVVARQQRVGDCKAKMDVSHLYDDIVAENENGRKRKAPEMMCRKCKGTKFSHVTIQLRRADEGSAHFITCLNPSCNHHWTIG